MSEGPIHNDDKHSNDQRLQDPVHPGMPYNPDKLLKQLGHANAHGGLSVGTGGHGATNSICSSSQPVGGKHVSDSSQFKQEELHPGMNPDPIERGRQLGHKNAYGGHSVGTGGHGPSRAKVDK
ncbi:unnamed protein product [Rotaria socialis]|uniref:Uncharacterized protein n=1 Tax=Rotaria socialis TaxID=392032 RepID=A0A817ZZ53_9BILA|nr:unnamed protein product [Rotaria socialis]CAF3420005.1 unnamed protein product [Rotaria socialis]CAF3429978.1 unnamed protein product [Rotaria socialis]CAF3490423.1 unnamed protein product [Rotaria socialis]CAF3503701.1 unnamed protein product [Rotaria socialis]